LVSKIDSLTLRFRKLAEASQLDCLTLRLRKLAEADRELRPGVSHSCGVKPAEQLSLYFLDSKKKSKQTYRMCTSFEEIASLRERLLVDVFSFSVSMLQLHPRSP
jgi:hypothetical protein